MGDTQVLDVIQPRLHSVGASCPGFRYSEELPFVLDAAVGMDRKIAYMGFIDNSICRFSKLGLLLWFPSFGVRFFQIEHNTFITIDGDTFSVGIDGFIPFIPDLDAVCVDGTVLIAGQGCVPGPLFTRFHLDRLPLAIFPVIVNDQLCPLRSRRP